MSRPPHHTRRRAGLAAVSALLALSGLACSSDEKPDPEPSGASSSPGADDAAPPVVTKATLGKVTGKLAAEPRARLVTAITTTVDAWIDAAFPAGPVAAGTGAAAFAVFTPGAATRARADAALLSNARLPADVESVALVNRRLQVDVLAVDGKAAGVTARVAVAMVLSGASERRERVEGTLSLTYDDGWRVFGYDMDRGEVR